MTKRRTKTLKLASGLKLREENGLFVLVAPPGTPCLSTADLLKGIRRMEDEEDLRQAQLAGLPGPSTSPRD